MAGKTAKQIQAILEAGKSPRFRRMEAYQRYWDGTIYEGRPGFLDQSIDVPLLERAPCVVYPIVRGAIQSIVNMSLGHGKFPEILSLTSEDDTTFDKRFGLDVEESVIVDAANKKIIEQTRLEAVSQQMAETALHSGTVVAVVSIQLGRLKISQLDPKTCIPTFSIKNPEELDSLEVSYRYVEDYFSEIEKKWHKRVMQFRRVIDKTRDVTFVPVEVKESDHYPKPETPDKDKTFTHGFGFCPVRWYACRAPVCDTADFDGRPIHWGLASQLDALHFSYSQRHRAAMYCGDPQFWETGVDPDDQQAIGRTSVAPQPTSKNPQGRDDVEGGWAFGGGNGSKPARKKGPGAVWQYSNADTKVGMMTLPGDALKAIDLHAADLRVKVCEALGVTFVDPAQLKGMGDISGKTLMFIFSNEVANCNSFREDFGKKCLLPLLNLIYRIILSPLKEGTQIYLAGVDKLKPLLARFDIPEIGWFDPSLKLIWGDYFEASDVDEATRTACALQALTAPTPVITLKTAVEHIKSVFAIQNTDQYVEALLAEKAIADAAMIEQAGALADATNVAKPGEGGAPAKKKATMTGKAGKKTGEASAQAESASGNRVPDRTSTSTDSLPRGRKN